MVRLVNSVVLVLPRGLELLGLKTYMCTVCTISSILLLFVVNIIHKCCKLVLVYRSRYIRHYLLTHKLYRMWYLVYHLCEVVCLMHNHLLCMYQMCYITYHKVVCHNTKLPILKKQYSINCKTCTTCNTSFLILDWMFWNVLHVPYFV